MADKMSPADALSAQLQSIPAYLRPSADIFDLINKAAGKISPTGGMAAAQQAAVIYKLSGEGAGYGDTPPPTSVHFPADHLMHLNCGNEWYWLSCHLDADGPNGPTRIAVLLDMLRYRLVSPDIQKKAGWSDVDAQLVWNAVTVVVSDAKGSKITRRNLNTQWAAAGGKVEFPSERFVYSCGPDSLIGGTANVLPLEVTVDDGSNMKLELTVTSDMPFDTAFFLQGTNGVTSGTKPGIYYSWPQLKVSGRVMVGGTSYQTKGKGWIDHQLLTSAPPLPPPAPQPPALPVDGWNWCEFNFDNGESYTCAAFQTGAIGTNKVVFYGFYLRPDGGKWLAEPVLGALAMDNLIPTLHQVMQPTSWTYTASNFPNLTGGPAPPAFEITVTTAPWVLDGSFETADLAVPSEVPVSAALINQALGANGSPLGEAVTGRGYCEAVGLEPIASYQRRGVAFLKAVIGG
jgi:predicted secreted hydrolase